ncbi:MAG: hypothetical protein ACT6WE_31005, partial [Shinella sp.]|uniref:hypothetical protein n=1 Tax=Shinella sp. TaxID=1870904 RepID=UPI00403750DB
GWRHYIPNIWILIFLNAPNKRPHHQASSLAAQASALYGTCGMVECRRECREHSVPPGFAIADVGTMVSRAHFFAVQARGLMIFLSALKTFMFSQPSGLLAWKVPTTLEAKTRKQSIQSL